MPEINVEMAAKFIRWLKHTHLYEIPFAGGSADHAPKFKDLSDLQTWLENGRDQQLNLYHAVNKPRTGLMKKAGEAEIPAVQFLHLDVDALVEDPKVMSDLLGMLTKSLPKGVPAPSAIVNSGGGYNALWRLKSETTDFETVKICNEILQTLFCIDGADASGTQDYSRILRLPGSWNHLSASKVKTKPWRIPSMARIIELNDNVYDLKDFGWTQRPSAAPSGTRRNSSAGGKPKFGPECPEWTVEPAQLTSDELDQLYEQHSVPARVQWLAQHGAPANKDGSLKPGWEECGHSNPSDKNLSDRNIWVLDVCCNLQRFKIPQNVVLGLLMDESRGLHDHIRDNGDGPQKRLHYARRQIWRARCMINQDPPLSRGGKNEPSSAGAEHSDEKTRLIIKGDPTLVHSQWDMNNMLVAWLAQREDVFNLNHQLARWSGSKGQMNVFESSSLGNLVSKSFVCCEAIYTKDGDIRHRVGSSIMPAGLMNAVLVSNLQNVRKCGCVYTHPTVDAAGEVHGLVPGYHATTQTIYHHDFSMLDMTPEESAAELYEPFREFAPKALVGTIAAIFSQLTRPHVGNTPMFLFEANNQGSGKSILASLCARIVTGEGNYSTASPANNKDGEFDKAINGLVLGGRGLIFLDNLKGIIDSSILDAALTSNDSYEGRLLGRSESVKVRFGAVVFATSNNAILSQDLHRRTIRIDVDPGVENPQFRTMGRTIPELEEYVRKNRVRLLSAAVRWLQHASTMTFPHLKALGSFEKWNAIVPKAAHALVTHWQREGLVPVDITNEVVVTSRSSVDADRLGPFLYTAHAVGSDGFKLLDVLDKNNTNYDALREVLIDLIGEAKDARAAASRLHQHIGRILHGMKLESFGSSKAAKRWRVVGTPAEAYEPPTKKAEPPKLSLVSDGVPF